MDRDLILKKLAEVEAYVHELRTLARPEEIERDIREERFVAHTLQLAIQAALDVASHIVSAQRLGEPETHHALFELLAKHGYLPHEQVIALRRMSGFRNLLVHEYTKVDLGVVRSIVEGRLDDLLSFVDAIRTSAG
ncbi:MAG: DUF86 domain-containing protein [Thermoanaerobaculia bacterium]|nr:DUF86 domain-containing protein [Thermoanaerobaculia bacterium]